MFNVHPRQFAYACGIPLGQRGEPPQRNCLAMFNVKPAAKFFNYLLMATKYQARIYVTLRSSVLDPAGTAVESGLKQMGYTEVESVRIGKYIEMQLTAANEEQALQHLDEMCDRLLANVVIENYRFELTELATA